MVNCNVVTERQLTKHQTDRTTDSVLVTNNTSDEIRVVDLVTDRVPSKNHLQIVHLLDIYNKWC